MDVLRTTLLLAVIFGLPTVAALALLRRRLRQRRGVESPKSGAKGTASFVPAHEGLHAGAMQQNGKSHCGNDEIG